jgi:hypothetical protein
LSRAWCRHRLINAAPTPRRPRTDTRAHRSPDPGTSVGHLRQWIDRWDRRRRRLDRRFRAQAAAASSTPTAGTTSGHEPRARRHGSRDRPPIGRFVGTGTGGGSATDVLHELPWFAVGLG